VAPARGEKKQVVAKKHLPWQAPHGRIIVTPRGARRSRSATVSGRAPPGRPSIQGVIVLTVKLFGETLKTRAP
jgi:hypothetical protein